MAEGIVSIRHRTAAHWFKWGLSLWRCWRRGRRHGQGRGHGVLLAVRVRRTHGDARLARVPAQDVDV